MLKSAITGLLLGTSLLLAQEKPDTTEFFNPDTTMTAELEEIVVNAEKEKVKLPETILSKQATLYYNDANKIAMSEYSGVFAIVPIFSKLRINNMDPKFVVMTYQDIPLIMNNTHLHGGLSAMNAQMFKFDIEKTAYPVRSPAIGSVLMLVPKEYEGLVLKLNTDLIERSGLGSFGVNLDKFKIRNTASFRNIGIPAMLENLVPELKVLPDIYETINHTLISKGRYDSEILARLSNGSGNFYDKNEDVNLDEHSSNLFVMTRQSLKLEDNIRTSLKFGYERNSILINYDFGDEEDNIRNFNKNTTLAASIEGNNFNIGSRMFFLSNATNDAATEQRIFDVYQDFRHVIGNILLEPSTRLMHDGKKWRASYGITGTYFLNNSSLKIGYSHPVNVLVVDNSSGEKNYRIGYLGPQFSDQYLASLNIRGTDISDVLKGILDEIDISYYHKYFHASKNEGGADYGEVKGWDLMIRNFGDINYTIKYSNGKAMFDGERMNEAVEDIVSADLGIPLLPWLSMNTQYMYNGGYNIRVRSDNSSHLVGKAHYVSAGLTFKFGLWGSESTISATASNLLRIFDYNHVPELARYKIGDNVKSINMPTLGNIVITVTKEF